MEMVEELTLLHIFQTTSDMFFFLVNCTLFLLNQEFQLVETTRESDILVFWNFKDKA